MILVNIAHRARLLVATAALAALAACDTSGYAFTADESIHFTAPKARSTSRLPVTIRWRDDEAPAGMKVDPKDPDAEYYGVFVDRSPMGPGKNLLSLIDDKDSCKRVPGCPSIAFLEARHVYLTATPKLTLQFLTDLRPGKRGTSKDPHEVTVVRMKGDSRVGEAAFRLSYFIRR